MRGTSDTPIETSGRQTSQRLRELLAQLRAARIPVAHHQGLLLDVAFELTTADTYIAGIASQLVDGRRPSGELLSVLQTPVVCGKRFLLASGHEVDLSGEEDLLRSAELLEQLRCECLRDA